MNGEGADRIEKLRQALQKGDEDASEAELFASLAKEVCEGNLGKPEIARKAEFLRAFAERFPVRCEPGELIVGSMRFCSTRWWHRGKAKLPEAFYGNMGHIIVDYGRVLQRGVFSLIEEAGLISGTDGRIRANRQAFMDALSAFSRLIGRYAESALQSSRAAEGAQRDEFARISHNCAAIAGRPPETFWQALQLVYFIQLFLHAEGMAAAVSFGRFDQFLDQYYRRDIASGILDSERAKELLKCFWLKTCEGDESQNLTLGGGGESELSLLCLEVAAELKVWQPSVSVRIGAQTSEAFFKGTLRLVKAGIGMPALFNDFAVRQSLIHAGVSAQDAEDYGIVGCYEANPQGAALGLTVAGSLRLYEALLGFLYGEPLQTDTFGALYEGFKAHFAREYREICLPGFRKTWERVVERFPSPFESACLSGCLDSGLAAEECGGKYTMFGVNMLGLGTTVDSLLAIKRLVFDEKRLTLPSFLDQVRNNFPDEALARDCRGMSGKYGADGAFANAIAHDLSEFAARLVLGHPIAENVIAYPGLFMFTADIYSQGAPATPDGRRIGERLSYGIGASDCCSGKTPTSVLNSASNVANDLCACGNPLMLSLGAGDVEGQKGDEILGGLIRGYFGRGGFHLQFNVVGADTLEDAKQNPDAHGDLLVRISGYSARFVALDPHMQDALIERARMGA
ncbi:MAG: hypothetical protein LBL83_06400 [Clostridiales bacterium]|jgi:formate C-acetyltransferase|nr:hypothetical protein [Clostridiales bacterium]